RQLRTCDRLVWNSRPTAQLIRPNPHVLPALNNLQQFVALNRSSFRKITDALYLPCHVFTPVSDTRPIRSRGKHFDPQASARPASRPAAGLRCTPTLSIRPAASAGAALCRSLGTAPATDPDLAEAAAAFQTTGSRPQASR